MDTGLITYLLPAVSFGGIVSAIFALFQIAKSKNLARAEISQDFIGKMYLAVNSNSSMLAQINTELDSILSQSEPRQDKRIDGIASQLQIIHQRQTDIIGQLKRMKTDLSGSHEAQILEGLVQAMRENNIFIEQAIATSRDAAGRKQQVSHG